MKKTKRAVLTTFWYVHLIFVFRLTFAREWFLVENIQFAKNEKISITQESIEKSEVDKLLNKNPINFSWWIFNQSLAWLFGFILLYSIFSSI